MPNGAEWIIIVAILLLLFSPQLPAMGRVIRDCIDELRRRLW